MILGSRRLFRFLALVATLVVGLVVVTVLQIPAAHATSTTFSYTGAEQQYTVPARISAVTITAIGAIGSEYYDSGPAGLGASVTATVPVTPGETLYVEVGGSGFTEDFDGGGTGNGSGGGASDVRTCSLSSCSLSSDDTRLVVAGGGGGAGGPAGLYEDQAGGNAGDVSVVGAGNAACGYGCDQPAGNGGFEGTAGGLLGGGPSFGGDQDSDGSLGQGGSGYSDDGGGGGGGYFGGGGGGYGAGGGGGSSYWIPSATNTSMTTATLPTPAGVVISTVPNITIGTTIPNPTFNTAYSANLSGNGGQAPYTFALDGGSSDGLSLSSDGTLSGIPNAVGPFFFTVTATDANGYTGTQNEEIIVDKAPKRSPSPRLLRRTLSPADRTISSAPREEHQVVPSSSLPRYRPSCLYRRGVQRRELSHCWDM